MSINQFQVTINVNNEPLVSRKMSLRQRAPLCLPMIIRDAPVLHSERLTVLPYVVEEGTVNEDGLIQNNERKFAMVTCHGITVGSDIFLLVFPGILETLAWLPVHYVPSYSAEWVFGWGCEEKRAEVWGG